MYLVEKIFFHIILISTHHLGDIMEKKAFITDFYQEAAKRGYPLRVEKLEEYSPILEFMQLTREDRLLDVGCGAGTFVSLAKKHCWSVGIDIVLHGCCFCVQGNGEALPFLENSFTVVYFSKSFPLMEMEHALKEAYRTSKPEGILMLRELVESTPWDDTVSWISRQLMRNNVYIPAEYPYIPEITLQSVEKFISPRWHVRESATFKTVLAYPSVDELIDRLVFYSPLSAITYTAPQKTRLLRAITADGVATFFGESLIVETEYFIIKAFKSTT